MQPGDNKNPIGGLEATTSAYSVTSPEISQPVVKPRAPQPLSPEVSAWASTATAPVSVRGVVPTALSSGEEPLENPKANFVINSGDKVSLISDVGSRRLITAAGLIIGVMIASIFLLSWRSNPPNKETATDTSTTDVLKIGSGINSIHLNRDTTISEGKKLTASGQVLIQNESNSTNAFNVQNADGNSLLVIDTQNGRVGVGAAPTGTATLQVAGNLSSSAAVQASGGGSSLSNQGLVINSVLVCTAAGCKNNTVSSGPDLSAYAKLSNLVGLASLSANQSFSGANSFSNINTTGGYAVNGTSGGSLSCAPGELLQQAVIQGGIIISGICVPGSGAAIATFQESYDASVPARVVLSAASGVLNIQDAASALGTNLFEVDSNGGATKYFAVSALGISVTGNINTTGQYQIGGVPISSANLSNDANLAKLNGNQTFTGNNTFSAAGNSFTGDGSGLTSLNATNLSSGTVNNLRLSASVTLAGNAFNGADQLVQLTSGGILPILSGANLTSLNATNISSGTVNDLRLSTNVTLAGNTFNGVNQLVKLDGSGKLPVLDGSALTNLNATNVSSGTLNDSRLSANVALLNSNNTFTGNNSIHLNSATFTVQDAASPLGTNLFAVTDNAGTTNYFSVASGGAKIGTFDVCTTAGNCAGAGSGVTTPGGTTNKIPKFTASQTIGDSIISDNGSTVTIGGTLAVNTISPTATLTVGVASQTLTLQGDGSTSLSATSGGIKNSLVFATPTVGNKTITVPNANGTIAVSASGPLALDAAGNLTCATCLTTGGGGGTAGVTTVNTLTGDIVLAGTTNQITITPSSNTLTFSTPQNIDTGATPTFANINVTGQYRVGGSQISSANLSNDSNLAKANGNTTFTGDNTFSSASNSFTGSGSGLTSLNATNLSSGTVNDSRLSANVALLNAANTFTNTNLVKLNNAAAFQIQNAINNEIFTADTSAGKILLGKASTLNGILVFNNSANANAITIQPAGSQTANYTLQLPSLAAGTYNICTDSGNCSGAGATLQTSYNNSTSPEITVNATNGAVTIQDNASPIAANLFEVQSNGGGTKYLAVDANGASVAGTVNVTTGYKVAGTSGSTTTCSGGNVLVNAVVAGGIITGGSCVANGGGYAPTFNNVYANGSNQADETATLTSGRGGLIIQDAVSPIGASLFTVQNNGGGIKFLDINATTIAISDNVTVSGTYNTNTFNSSTLQFGAAGTATLDSASGQTLQIGTGANAHNVTIGNNTGTSAVSVVCGTGTCGFGNNATDHSTTVGSTTGTSAMTIRVGTGLLNVGDNGTDHSSVFGSNTGSSQTVLRCGTTGCELGSSDGIAHPVTVGSVVGASITYLQGGTAGIQIGNNGVANTIQVGNTTGAVAQTINIGNNATASSNTTLTLGSIIDGSTTNIKSGTGGTALSSNGATIVKSLTDSATAFQIQNSSSTSLFTADTLNSQITQSRSIFTGNILPTTAATVTSQSTVTTKIADADSMGTTSSIAIGVDGLPVISHSDITLGDLAVTKCTNPSCSASTTTKISDAHNAGNQTSIAIGSDGLPVIAHQDQTSGDLDITKCNNTSCSSNSTTTISDASNVGSYTSIAIGTDGLPVISYQDTTNLDLAITKCGNLACSSGNTTTKISDANDTGFFTSLAIGTDGFPIISHEDSTTGYLAITKCSNVSCSSSSTTKFTYANGVSFNSIAIGADGMPVIAFDDQSNADVTIAKCANTSCSSGTTTTRVADANLTGGWVSLAIPADGLPVISHQDATLGDLAITKCSNISCTASSTTKISDANNVGTYTSIAVGSDGLPVISYRDATATDLAITKCGNADCSGSSSVLNGGISLGSAATSFQNAYIQKLQTADAVTPFTIDTNGITRLSIDGAGNTSITGFVSLQPATSLVGGQTNITQTLTNASSTGGTVNGYNQTITVAPTSSPSTTNGFNISITDNTSLTNPNSGINITMAGTGVNQAQYGVQATVNHGIGIKAVSTGNGLNEDCNGNSNYSIGVCGLSTANSITSTGVYGNVSAGSGSLTGSANGGSGIYASNTSAGSGGSNNYFGLKAYSVQTTNAAYNSYAVYGVALGGTGSTVYGGSFNLDSGSTATLGAALHASNSSVASGILQLQDNTTDVFTVGDGGSVSMTPSDATKTIVIGSTSQTGSITLGQSTATNTISIGGGAGNGNTQTINIGNSSTGGSTTNITLGSTVAGTTTIQSGGGVSLATNTTVANDKSFIAGGTALFKDNTNTATAFQVQSSGASETLLSINTLTRTGGTAGNLIKVGNSTGTDTDATVLQLDGNAGTLTTNLASLNGGLYYNSSTNHINIIENGIVKEVCNKVDLVCGAGATTTLQNTYDQSTGSTTPEIILNNGGTDTGGIDIQNNNGSPVSGSLFAIRDKTASGLGTSMFGVADTGFITLQPATSLISGQTHISQTLTNASSTGGTVQGYSQAITVAPTSSASTTNGFVVSLTDATTLANTSTGVNATVTDNGASGAKTNVAIKATAAGTNTGQLQYAVDASANHGIAIRGASTGIGGSVVCGPTTAALSIGVCGSTSQASSAGYGGYFAATGNGGTALYATNDSSTANILQLQDGTSPTNVLTVADGGVTTFKSAVNNTSAFQVQTAAGAPMLNIDTTNPVTDLTNNGTNNLITNGSFEVDFSGWTAEGAGVTPLQSTVRPYLGTGALSVTTPASTNRGIKYNLTTTTLASNTKYNLTLMARMAAGTTMSTLEIGHADDGSTDTNCLTAQTITGNNWTNFSCSFTTGATSSTPYIYIKQTDATARTFFIDAVQLTRFSLLTNASIEQAIAGNWQADGTPTTHVRDTVQFYDGGAASLKVTTQATAGQGTKQNITLSDSTSYQLTFYAMYTGTALTTMQAGYAADGSTETNCFLDNQVVNSSWSQFSCAFTTPSSHSGTPYIYIKNSAATVRTFFMDDIQLTVGNPVSAYKEGTISLNGIISSPTIFQNQSNSTQAFAIQNASGGSHFVVDTVGSNITLNGLNSGDLSTWKSTTAIPAAKNGQATVIVNGYIYVIGGNNSSPSNSVYYAKLNTDGSISSWTTQTSNLLPSGRALVGATTANGYIYVVGGRNAGNATSETDTVYFAKVNSNGSTGPWSCQGTAVATSCGVGSSSVNSNGLPLNTVELTTAQAFNGYLYVWGGFDNLGATRAEAWFAKIKADGSTGPFMRTTQMPGTRSGGNGIIANGYIYWFGGYDAGSATNNVYYAPLNSDGSIGSWTDQATNKLPVALTDQSVAVANGYVYQISGTTTGFDAGNQANVYYAPLLSTGGTGSWNMASSSALARSDTGGNSNSVVANGYIYQIGGTNTAGTIQTTVSYTSTARIKAGGSLDLVGLGAQSLAGAGIGGSLTAGNTNIVGDLMVRGQVNFAQGVAVNNNLSVAGGVSIKGLQGSSNFLQVQNGGGVNALAVSTVNLVTNSSFESGPTGSAPDGWIAQTNGVPTTDSTQAKFGLNSMKIVSPGALDGVQYLLTFTPSATYNLSFYARTASGTINDMEFGYMDHIGNNTCLTAQTVTTAWTRYTCSFSVVSNTGQAGLAPYVYIEKTGAGSETFFVDGVQLEAAGSASTYREADIKLDGQVTFKNSADSASAFQIQNAAGTTLFSTDTSGSLIQIGSSSTDATAVLLVLDSYNQSTDPTGVAGAIYYNTSMNSFRCYDGTGWVSCIGGLLTANTSIPGGNTVSNTTTETNFSSNYTMAANYCGAGRVVRITAQGLYSTDATAHTLTLRVKAGATVLTASPTLTPTNGLSNRSWRAEFQMTCDAAPSASSATEGQGILSLFTTNSAASLYELANTSTVNLATNGSLTMQMSAQWGTGVTASDTITLRQIIVEGMGP